MREIIDRLLQGKYVYAQRNLDFSTARIELSIGQGEVTEGSFTIFGSDKSPVEGRISTTDIRMELVNDTFSGSPYEVSYRFNGKGLSQGDVLKGEFRIISNQGEYMIPFVVTVRMDTIASSLGDIKNLFHFANLAKTDWDEAVNLFYQRDFISVFKGNDAQYESLYRGLSYNPDNQQNVEEFLIAINKKQPVKYILEQTELQIDFTGLLHDTGVLITRSGWGYTHLFAKVCGDFLTLDKYEISEEDFTGSNARLGVLLRTENLHEGNNFARIELYNNFTSVSLPVTVTVNLSDALHMTADYSEMKRLTVQLVGVYENFSCKKITSRAWLTETGKIIARMNAIDDKKLETRLYTAQYYITAGRVNEGKWLLDQSARDAQEAPGDTLYSYYLYLSTLCSREESYINDVTERLEGIYRRNQENWRIAWLLLYVSDDYSQSASRKWLMLQEQFGYGCRSPILYLEAMNLLNENPSMLTHLDSHEKHVLEYGARKNLISLNLVDQIVYLSMRVRTFDKKLFGILKSCYEMKESTDVLEAIVSMLIKGGRTDRDAFFWYMKGVEKELRITRLYEYYMMSIYTDEDGLLPCEISKMVLMYFSYQSDLEYDKNAILYRYIHEHRQDYPELYESYVPQIEKYLMAQLDRGRINQDLGYLYENMLTRQMVDASNASKVLSILYTSQIKVNDKKISGVCVIYDKLSGVMRYPVVDGMAYVPLYGSDYAVLLSDHDDNRYAKSVPYTETRMMLAGGLSEYAIPYIQNGKENLDLFLCELGKNAYTIDIDNAARYRELASSELVRKKCRNEIRNNLVRFYYDNDFTRQLTEYLTEMDPDELSGNRRVEMLELMVMSGLYDKALNWAETYGTYGVDPRIILRLCVRLLDRGNLPAGKKEIEIAHYAFRAGKYDEQLLSYLTVSFNGTVREMRDIWKAAESFGLDTYSISERMLIQMLYSGAYIGEKNEIFRHYVESTGNSDIEIAYLSQNAYDNFAKGTVADRYIFERIEKLALDNAKLPQICALSYLRYFAYEKKNDERVNRTVASLFLKDLLSKSVYFPFFMEYAGLSPEMAAFIDKTMIEYRTSPDRKCIVHYRLDSDPGNDYRTREMRQMYDGIYVSEFVLFFGEQMQYYITEEGQEETLTESGTIQKSDIVGGQIPCRYSLINDICIGETLQDFDTVDSLIDEYYRKDFICNRLFTATYELKKEG